MTPYKFLFRDQSRQPVRLETVDCHNDDEALRTAGHIMSEPFAILEIWRGELVYEGTGKAQDWLAWRRCRP